MRSLAIVFVMGVVARLGGQMALGAYAAPETWEYEDVARNLLAGHGYTYIKSGATYVASQSSPLYILLTVGVYAVTSHSQTAMLVLQALLGGATASLCAWFATRLYSPRAGWLAGSLVALDPALVVYAAKLHSLTLDALAFVGATCALIGMPTRPKTWRAGLTGVLVGLAALTRATSLVLLPFQCAWLMRFRSARGSAVIVLVALAVFVYAPWPVRNSILLGQIVPSSSEATEWLWRGTNPSATGTSWTADGRTLLDAAPTDFQARVADASEAERIDIYRDAAFEFIAHEPGRALLLYLTKLRLFWWPDGSNPQSYPAAWLAIYTGWYAAVLAFAAFAAWRGLRDPASRSALLLVLATLAIVSASQALFYVEGRHRLAIEPLLLVLAGAGLAGASEVLAMRRVTRQALGTSSLVIVVAAVVGMLGVSQAFELAANDLNSQIVAVRGDEAQSRRQPGMWLADRLGPSDDSVDARILRMHQLDQRGDRLRETAAVVTLLGLLLTLAFQTVPGAGSARRDSQPLASTSTKGST